MTAGYTLLLLLTVHVAEAVDEAKGSIRGTVTNAATGEPLRKAYVRLASASDGGKVRPTVTDDVGRYVFRDVRPGNYSVEAEHQGFMDGRYGSAAGMPLELKISTDQDLSGIN